MNKLHDLGRVIADALASALGTADLRELVGADASTEWRLKYWRDPVGWARDNIRWPINPGTNQPTFLAPHQQDILTKLYEHHRVAAWGPRGLGKSCVAAHAVLHFVTTRDGYVDWKLPTTAGGYRQIEEYLWPEIHKWARLLRWDRIGRRPWNKRNELMQIKLAGETGSAFGAACDNPDLIEGGHASQILFVFDESKAIPDGVFDAVEGMLTQAGIGGREAFLLALSTPGPPVGRFYQICKQIDGYKNWYPRPVELREAIEAELVNEQWAQQCAEQWGVSSTLFQCHVLGRFADTTKDGVIPPAWVESAQARAVAQAEGPEDGADKIAFGVDVARGSANNETVIAIRKGWAIIDMICFQNNDLMEVVRAVIGQAKRHKPSEIVIDSVGIGAGPFEFLREKGYPVIPFHAGETAPDRDFSGEIEFVNRRSWAWWRMRELLHPYNGYKISLPDDSDLLTQLSIPIYQRQGNRLMVERKEDIEKKLRKANPHSTKSLSTDRADAVVMAFADPGSRFEDSYGLMTGQQLAVASGSTAEEARALLLKQRQEQMSLAAQQRAEWQEARQKIAEERERRARPETQQIDDLLFRGARRNHDVFSGWE